MDNVKQKFYFLQMILGESHLSHLLYHRWYHLLPLAAMAPLLQRQIL